MLAPLEDYSGPAFRSLCHKYGADLTFTEMVRVEGTVRNNKATLSKLCFPDNTPIQIQFLIGNENQLEKYLSSFKSFDGFEGFNLNLGCPSAEIIKAGRGAGMVKRLSKAQRTVAIVKKQNHPVSIKMRLGANALEKSYKVYLRLIQNVDVDFFIVHPKHGMVTSDEPTDDLVYLECVDAAKARGIPIIANGGIDSKQKIDWLKSIGVGGAMIGRAAITNPSIFNLLLDKKVPSKEALTKEYAELSKKLGEKEKYLNNYLKWASPEKRSNYLLSLEKKKSDRQK